MQPSEVRAKAGKSRPIALRFMPLRTGLAQPRGCSPAASAATSMAGPPAPPHELAATRSVLECDFC